MSKFVEKFLLTNNKKQSKIEKQMEVRRIKNISVQQWLPLEEILENGIIKINKNKYIKILKIIPINYNLKSDLEKKTILNSYKILLKTCNFNIQILIQSNKEDLSKNISIINNQLKSENNKISEISKKYIKYINELNNKNKSSSKNFYLIIKYENKNLNEINNIENYAYQELNDKYFKIRDCLSRCGNILEDINSKKEVEEILESFINKRQYFKEKQNCHIVNINN